MSYLSEAFSICSPWTDWQKLFVLSSSKQKAYIVCHALTVGFWYYFHLVQITPWDFIFAFTFLLVWSKWFTCWLFICWFINEDNGGSVLFHNNMGSCNLSYPRSFRPVFLRPAVANTMCSREVFLNSFMDNFPVIFLYTTISESKQVGVT